MVKKIRIFMNQKVKENFFEKREEEVSFESLSLDASAKNLLDAISFHLADPVTVLLGRTELALDQINNGGMKEKEMKEFVKLCKEELKDICFVFDALRTISEIENKNLPTRLESSDGINNLKVEKLRTHQEILKKSGSLDERNHL